ncbi:MAG: hypothetical protein HeimC3_17360 [Candidatus Heimdallarchaeota archaeon LC_3]|nr:MAG: hypothetical protein HeimC3_17360 [Candidatus Heimdallarchaeota archaeon LC_3]
MKIINKIPLILVPLLFLLLVGGIFPVSAIENSFDQTYTFDQRRPSSGMMPNSPRYDSPLPDDIIMNHSISENRTEMRNRHSYFMVDTAGNVPFYRWYGLDNYSAYLLKIMSIIEYDDTNGDGQFQPNETVFHIQLQGNVDWTFTREAANETTVTFSFYSSNIRLPGFEETIINLTNYLNRETKYLKFDIEIVNWPWNSSTDRLAFHLSFLSKFNDARERNIERLYKTDQNIINRTNEEGLFLRNNEGKIAGYFSSASIAYAGSVDGSIDVTTQIEFQRQLKSAEIFLNYPYFGDYLLHDPNIGIGDEEVGTLASTINEFVELLISKSGLFFLTTFVGLAAIGIYFVSRKRL